MSVKSLKHGRKFAYLMLGLFIIMSLGPLWIALKTALVPSDAMFQAPGSLLPTPMSFENFGRVLGLTVSSANADGMTSHATVNFALALRNSVILTAIVVFGQVFFSALAAYGFARLRFPGRDTIFFLLICATMIPNIVMFIPNFILIKNLGWLNTFAGLAAPYALMTPFAVFFLRQFFLSTPAALEEAALLDGASRFRIFWEIVLPLHKSAIATLAILVSINTWNDFFWPFLVGNDESVRVMAVAINAYREQKPGTTPDWGGLMACTVLSIIPIIAVLFAFGRKVVESLQFSGIK
jgi:multiple sugar transport system permease protein